MISQKLKCGIEIHQQLETNKLFCNCPSLVNDPNKPDTIIKRKLRTTAGESGLIDIAARYEKIKDKTFIYEACSTSSCLVELDEEPPKKLNQEALKIALEISLLLNAKIIDNIQFMRKIVIDGSNTSGFQRTALIAIDGYINTSKGKINIPTICLEEEAAKKIREDEKTVTYRLDRLGVPLIEIATAPEIKDPEHAKETASILGMILRSTNKVKRGLGTIRQDLNLSVNNSPRIELKGFQDLGSIPKVLENEIKRIKKEKPKNPEVRKVNPDFTTTFMRPMPGAERMYPETDIQIIKINKKLLDSIKLPKLITEELKELQKKYNLTPELSKELINNEYFETFIKKYKNIPPLLIAQLLIEYPKDIKTRYKIDKDLTKEQFDFVLDFLNKNKIPKNTIIDILVDLLNNKKIDLNEYKPISKKELEKEIENIIKEKKDLTFKAIMGIIMNKHKGKVNGKEVADILKKLKRW